MKNSPYGWLMLAGIFVSILFWSRVARRDERLVLIYVAALAGAFLGAKVVYLGAEGWLHWHDENRWIVLATGKSITGALLGGYAAVEIAKYFLRYTRTTGDWFALVKDKTAEPMWRVEGTLKLGEVKYSAARLAERYLGSLPVICSSMDLDTRRSSFLLEASI